MPAYIDARCPGVDLTFLRGTARNVPFLFPTGTLAGRTFTATLDAVSLTTSIVSDTLTVSVTVAQTNAAANGPLAFVLTETTGVDQPIVIGTWRASTRPQAVTPQTSITVTTNTETIQLQVVSGTDLPELVAGDPAEVDLNTVAGVTTLTLLETIARRTHIHRIGQYFFNFYDGYTGNAFVLNTLYFQPTVLSAGTIDRIGIEVTTLGASAIVRLGIYSDNGNIPLALIAEATSTADASTTGVKDLTIAATIPKTGVYWFAAVNQTAVCSVQHGGRGLFVPLPLGTAAPSGAGGPKSLTQTGVTGALPSNVGTLVNGFNIHSPRIHYRYSA